MKDHPNDISVLSKAKRCINIVDLLSDTVRLLQSIPSRINCLIFGNCEANNDDNAEGGTDENNGSDETEEQEEEQDEEDGSDKQNDPEDGGEDLPPDP